METCSPQILQTIKHITHVPKEIKLLRYKLELISANLCEAAPPIEKGARNTQTYGVVANKSELLFSKAGGIFAPQSFP